MIAEAITSPGMVVLTVGVAYPGGSVVYFNVTVRPNGDEEYATVMTFPISDSNPNQSAQLSVLVPSGGNFTLTVISFNSLGSLEISDTVMVENVPPGNVY